MKDDMHIFSTQFRQLDTIIHILVIWVHITFADHMKNTLQKLLKKFGFQKIPKIQHKNLCDVAFFV